MSKRNTKLNTALSNELNEQVDGETEASVGTNVETGTAPGSRKKYDEVAVRKEAKELLGEVVGVSASIRKLYAAGWEKGKIAVALDKRYQHVRNVLLTPVKS